MDAGNFRFWFNERISSTGAVDVINRMEVTPMTKVLPANALPIHTPSSARAYTLTKNNPTPKAMNGMWAAASHLPGTLPMVSAMMTSTIHSAAGRIGSQINSSDTDSTNRLMSLIDGFHRVSAPGSTSVEGCWMVRVLIPTLLGSR